MGIYMSKILVYDVLYINIFYGFYNGIYFVLFRGNGYFNIVEDRR